MLVGVMEEEIEDLSTSKQSNFTNCPKTLAKRQSVSTKSVYTGYVLPTFHERLFPVTSNYS